jgi:hypothetical protein
MRSRAKGSDAPAEDGARRGLPPLYAPKLLEKLSEKGFEQHLNREFGGYTEDEIGLKKSFLTVWKAAQQVSPRLFRQFL